MASTSDRDGAERSTGQQTITGEGNLGPPKLTPQTSPRRRPKIPAWAQPIVAELASLRLQVGRSTADAATTPGHPCLNVAIPEEAESEDESGDADEEEVDETKGGLEDDTATVLSRESLLRQATGGRGNDRDEELASWVAKLKPLARHGSRLPDRERYEIRSNLILYRLWNVLDAETRVYVRERLRLLVAAHLFGWGPTLRVARREEARSLGFNPDEYLPLASAGRGWHRPSGSSFTPRPGYHPATDPTAVSGPRKRRRGKRGSGRGREAQAKQ